MKYWESLFFVLSCVDRTSVAMIVAMLCGVFP